MVILFLQAAVSLLPSISNSSLIHLEGKKQKHSFASWSAESSHDWYTRVQTHSHTHTHTRAKAMAASPNNPVHRHQWLFSLCSIEEPLVLNNHLWASRFKIAYLFVDRDEPAPSESPRIPTVCGPHFPTIFYQCNNVGLVHYLVTFFSSPESLPSGCSRDPAWNSRSAKKCSHRKESDVRITTQSQLFSPKRSIGERCRHS